MSRTDIQQEIHITQIAIEMDRNNGFGARSNSRFDFLRIDTPTVRQDVDENRFRAEVSYWRNRGNPVGISNYDLIASTDTKCCKAHVQCPGATRCRYGVLHPQVCRERLLKARNVVIAVFAPTVAGGIRGVGHL